MPVNLTRAKELLSNLWSEILESETQVTDTRIEELIDSKQVAIRYALPTQILGKLHDATLDALCLQRGDGSDPSRWDPRGFSSSVIVPWVSENQNVLGTSGDPYVGKPLRKTRLEENPENVKKKDEWIKLYEILAEIQERNDPSFTEDKFRQVLSSIHKRLIESNFEFVVPSRISLNQTNKLVETFLSEGSGGDRGLAVAAALFETIKQHFNLYSTIRRSVINASDASTGLVADIECLGTDGEIKLAIEVKERSLTLSDLTAGVLKARRSEVTEFLFNTPAINPTENAEIAERIQNEFNLGTNIYHVSISDLVQVVLTLTGEDGRRDFLVNIGVQLNEFNTQPQNRLQWRRILEEI